MILRQSAGTPSHEEGFSLGPLLGITLGLRTRIALLTGVLVACVAGGATMVSYWAALGATTANMDHELDMKADVLLSQGRDGASVEEIRYDIASFKLHNPYVRAAYSSARQSVYIGDALPIGGTFIRNERGEETSVRTVGGDRVLVKRNAAGESVALAQNIDPKNRFIGSLGAIVMVVVGLGFLLAWAVGELVSAAGMRPITRLQRAIDRVRRTEDLRGIQVEGDDELARLSITFNEMMESLEESRRRQAQLVADASHELKTPLTSMRTNIELLMMLCHTGQLDKISGADRAELERDVMDQMEEMSTLINDLVDLAREDSPHAELEPIRLDHVVAEAVKRVRRRRPDVTFQFHADPWMMMGDRFAMGRAPVNLIDNAAKWSPPQGTVRISLKAASRKAVLLVDDSGPGIPEEERGNVFERFYRAPEARSLPGSGLGLAIARQVIVRHGGTISVEESDDGGARFCAVFPGWRPAAAEIEETGDIAVLPPTSPGGFPRVVPRATET